jgi:hypothetical protein
VLLHMGALARTTIAKLIGIENSMNETIAVSLVLKNHVKREVYRE